MAVNGIDAYVEQTGGRDNTVASYNAAGYDSTLTRSWANEFTTRS
jgi:hypothetical protein